MLRLLKVQYFLYYHKYHIHILYSNVMKILLVVGFHSQKRKLVKMWKFYFTTVESPIRPGSEQICKSSAFYCTMQVGRDFKTPFRCSRNKICTERRVCYRLFNPQQAHSCVEMQFIFTMDLFQCIGWNPWQISSQIHNNLVTDFL